MWIGVGSNLIRDQVNFLMIPKNQKGFSLIELILVMALIGIMSFVAIPAVNNTQAITMEGAARKLEGDIRYAQNLATTTGDSYGFRTTGSDNTGYEIYKVSNNTAVTSPYSHTPMQEDFAEGYSGITFDATHSMTFDESGLPNISSGGNTINLVNTSDETKSILINNSGLISIQ